MLKKLAKIVSYQPALITNPEFEISNPRMRISDFAFQILEQTIWIPSLNSKITKWSAKTVANK